MKWLGKTKDIKVLPPLEAYNSWAATYHQEPNPIKNLSDQLVRKLLPDLRGKAVLDAGCGTGTFCLLAEQQMASEILGIDLSPSMIDAARKFCTSAQFKCGDISSMTIEEKRYDIIICALMMGHLEHLHPGLDNLLMALKQGGALILTDFHPFLTLSKSKRTFYDKQSGKSFEVLHYLHLFGEYITCFNKHGTSVETLQEPLFNGVPAVFGFRIRKP